MQSRRIITLDNMLCAASRGESEAVKVDAVLRRKVEDGIASLGYRVTVGDVAGQAGLPLADIQPVLNALASDCLAKLEVRVRARSKAAAGDAGHSTWGPGL